MVFKHLTANLLSLRRFSLRTFLLLVLLAGCGFGGITRWYQTVRESGNAQLRLVEGSTPVPAFSPIPVYDVQYPSQEQPSWFTSLARKWVHPEYNRPFANLSLPAQLVDTARANDVRNAFGVKSMGIRGAPVTPTNAALLFQAKGLETISIAGSDWPDEPLLQLKHARHLKTFSTGLILSDKVCLEIGNLSELTWIRLTACKPEEIPLLAKTKRLEKLEILSIRHSSTDFRSLEQSEAEFKQRCRIAMQQSLKELKLNQHFSYLSIDGTLGLTREDVADFCSVSKIKTLLLQSPEIAPECLEEFAKLTNLESLTIYDLAIQDKHLPSLAKAKNLKQLTIGPHVTREAIRALREQMPGCKIERY